MAQVRPDEVSAILREQLSNFKTESELEEVGTTLQVGDGVARIYGLTNAQAGELLEFENGLNALVLNLEEDNVGAVLLGDSSDVKEGDTVKRTGKIGSIQVGKYADFVVLEKNPLEVPVEALEDINIEKTYVSGNELF